MGPAKQIAEHSLYTIEYFEAAKSLVHKWRPEAGNDISRFKPGVATFAAHCADFQPAHAVFDASGLDPDGPVVSWISGRRTPKDQEAYGPWWMREIVSVYNQAGLKSLAIASGDPNASGEQANSPPGCQFKMGFFTDLKAAMAWQPK